MPFHWSRVASVGWFVLSACGDPLAARSNTATRADTAVEVAGGESSEFSGGEIPAGYCPVVVSRTELDPGRADLAPWMALAAGHREVPLRWTRGLPDDTIRGFEERTELLLDVTAVVVEDVVCGPGPVESYESSGFERNLRRFELSIELSSADGAVHASFQQPFLPSIDAKTGARLLSGGAQLPFEETSGTLELGAVPEARVDSKTLYVNLTFSEQAVVGSITPWILLQGPYSIGGGRPAWVPVSGVFPAPDEGCDAGTAVGLDEQVDVLRDTPRNAYEQARSKIPAEPVRAAWTERPLVWTEVTLSAGALTHACRHGDDVQLYTSLRIESADGVLDTEQPMLATIFPHEPLPDGSASPAQLYMGARSGWAPRANFEASAGFQNLDLGNAEYGTLALSFHLDLDQTELQGDLYAGKWEDYVEVIASPSLHWCAGARCARIWCVMAATDDGSSCL
jgi:hypothetical protein